MGQVFGAIGTCLSRAGETEFHLSVSSPSKYLFHTFFLKTTGYRNRMIRTNLFLRINMNEFNAVSAKHSSCKRTILLHAKHRL